MPNYIDTQLGKWPGFRWGDPTGYGHAVLNEGHAPELRTMGKISGRRETEVAPWYMLRIAKSPKLHPQS
jgi:hypothetical protein